MRLPRGWFFSIAITTPSSSIQATLAVPTRMMPSFAGRFSDEQMSALIAYLHTGLR
jgi:hypothetical protein